MPAARSTYKCGGVGGSSTMSCASPLPGSWRDWIHAMHGARPKSGASVSILLMSVSVMLLHSSLHVRSTSAWTTRGSGVVATSQWQCVRRLLRRRLCRVAGPCKSLNFPIAALMAAASTGFCRRSCSHSRCTCKVVRSALLHWQKEKVAAPPATVGCF